MTLVRTTFQPWVPIEVSDAEFTSLSRAGLLYGSAQKLYVNFYTHTDGYPASVSGVEITITGPDPETTIVVGPTSVGIEEVIPGAFAFAWGAVVDPGSYEVTWDGLDADGFAVSASETVVVEE